MIYSESESELDSNIAFNLVSDFDSASESDSESDSDSSSVLINLDIYIFFCSIFTLFLINLRIVFSSILITESIVMQAM